MGIKNHVFMLSLLDRDLQGVDPFDEASLTPALKLKILNETKRNFWYYIREISRMPITGGGLSRYIANRSNIASNWLHFNHVQQMVTQLRQTGKSASMYDRSSYLMNFGGMGIKMNLITKDDDLRQDTIAKMKLLMDNYPKYLRQRNPKKDNNNSQSITVKSLYNEYKAHIGAASKAHADRLGRGLTSPLYDFDEVAFIFNNEKIVSAALGGGGNARMLAKQNNTPYGTTFVTTAGDLSTPHGEYAYKLFRSGAKWSEKFLDTKDVVELEKVIRNNTKINKNDKNGRGVFRVSLEFNHRQLGYDDKFLQEKLEEAIADGEQAKKDYFNIWTAGGDANPIPDKFLETIAESKVTDYLTEISEEHGYITRWYIDKDRRESFNTNGSWIKDVSGKPRKLTESDHLIIGLDTSDAVGLDGIGLVARSAVTGEVVAVGEHNDTNLYKYTMWLIEEWFLKFSNILLIIERRSSGVYIIDVLLHVLPKYNIDPFKVLFNWKTEEVDLNSDFYKEVLLRPVSSRRQDIYTEYKTSFGYATSGGTGKASRYALYDESLMTGLKFTGVSVRDSELINQMSSLVRKNGRIDHAIKKHDDLLIAWLLTFWWLHNTTNSKYYGIPRESILSNLINSSNYNSDDLEEYHTRQQNIEIHGKINQLLEYLKQVRGVEHSLTKRKIENLKSRLDPEYVVSANINELIDSVDVKDDKKRNGTNNMVLTMLW
jgi:hypothetical protein